MANDAIHANPFIDNVEVHITTHGSDWLWAAFAIMLLTGVIVLAWSFAVPRGQRVFHHIGLIILFTASTAYFSMASNLGYTGIATEFAYEGFAKGVYRQIWYVRYIDWVITTPLLLLELLLASGLTLSDILTVLFFDELMIITGLVGALVASSYKWGYFAGGCIAEFYVLFVLFGPARKTAGIIGKKYASSLTTSSAMLSVLWILYPVAWGLADGSSYISPDSEMVFYGVLDVLAKPVFILFHLFQLSKLDLTALQLRSGKFSASAVGAAPYDHEKAPRLTAIDNPPRQPAHIAAVENIVQPTTAKKGMFSRKGE